MAQLQQKNSKLVLREMSKKMGDAATAAVAVGGYVFGEYNSIGELPSRGERMEGQLREVKALTGVLFSHLAPSNVFARVQDSPALKEDPSLINYILKGTASDS